jgi:ketosteroid isomerase-like protein
MDAGGRIIESSEIHRLEGDRVADDRAVIEQAYSAFNRRDIDGALALMTEDVSWPKASEGGRVVGKEEIRGYWTRQWDEFDPHVEPVAMSEEEDGRIRVKVQQVVKSLAGEILFDGEVVHVFTMKSGLIAAMDIGDARRGRMGGRQRLRIDRESSVINRCHVDL